jgi:NAD(P)-dependent dehydrogenase (short-subunit alcohol dehydrogenase family)
LRADLSRPADIGAVVEATGKLGALVVTAGLSPSMAAGRRIYEVDLVGPAHLVRAYEPALVPGSAAVLFASMAGHLVPPMPELDAVLDQPLADSFFADLGALGIDVDEPGSAYGLAKRGLIRLVQRSASAWGARGARLVSVSPGIVDTGMGRLEWANQPVMQTMVEGSALRRMLQADELAAVAAFLVSEPASALTGTDILVDGGAVAGLGSLR